MVNKRKHIDLAAGAFGCQGRAAAVAKNFRGQGLVPPARLAWIVSGMRQLAPASARHAGPATDSTPLPVRRG